MKRAVKQDREWQRRTRQGMASPESQRQQREHDGPDHSQGHPHMRIKRRIKLLK